MAVQTHKRLHTSRLPLHPSFSIVSASSYLHDCNSVQKILFRDKGRNSKRWMVRMIEGDGKWRFITSLSKWAFGQPVPSFMGNPFIVYIVDWEYIAHVHVDINKATPYRSVYNNWKKTNWFTIVNNIDTIRGMYHMCGILKILFIPGCDADVADSVFLGHSWLCVNWKSTAADLLCPLKTLWVNLASALHLLRYTPTACPWEGVRARTGFNFHLFFQYVHIVWTTQHLSSILTLPWIF